MQAVPAGPGSPPAGGQPSVEFHAGRRPESGTRIRMESFDGPLAMLLAVIEARRLDVLTVPLGALADAYLDALATLEVDRIGHVSSFVTVASQLILIKSRALLPRREEPAPVLGLEGEGLDPEAELRARLILYRAYRNAGNRLADDALLLIGLFRREPVASRNAARGAARPADGPPISPGVLVEALAGLVRVIPEAALPPEVIPRSITLAERASIIRDALRGAGPIVLQELLNGVRDRMVVAVTFMAMLELVKRREIAVEQALPWGPIVVRQTTLEERGGVTAEALADAPIDESMDGFG